MRLPRLPSALLWDHNAHFHGWVLRRWSGQVGRALDVGCGAGAFAMLLASRAEHVDGIDASAAMIDIARHQPGADRVTWVAGDVLDADLEPASYDVVTAIASLHHLPLQAGLARLGTLVHPGGRLIVVGLARPASWRDYRVDVVTMVLNPIVGAVRAVRRRPAQPGPMPPLRDPAETVDEIADVAHRLLPGSRVRRHLFFRYTLLWTAPLT